MEDYETIRVHRAVCVIEPQLMTITPIFKTGTKIIVSRITGEIVSQDILLGLGISPKRRIALHDIVRVVGRRIQGDHILRPFNRNVAPFFYQIFITNRAGDTFAFASISEPSLISDPQGTTNARKKGEMIIKVLRKWIGLPIEDDSIALPSDP